MKQVLALHTRVPSDRKEEANTMDRFQVERATLPVMAAGNCEKGV
jgi:hypothetical protein